MTECERIAELLRRAHDGPSWHGPALMELLGGLAAAQAAARPPVGSHSIWQVVRHVTNWDDTVRRIADGELVRGLPPELDWPAVDDASDHAWHRALEGLEHGQRRLRAAIARMSDRRLDEPVPGDHGLSVYQVLHGVVHHTLYHAGQVALLKAGRVGP